MLKFGEFELTSGKTSAYYIDLRRLISYPRLMKKIAKMIIEKVEQFETVAGIATGGVPLSSFVSAVGNIPGAYVRKKEKGHGTSKAVEGEVKGNITLLVDDVTTTGGSLSYGIKMLRDNEAIVNDVLVVVDRQEGAEKKINDSSVTLHALLTISEIVKYLQEENLLKDNERDSLQKAGFLK